MGRGLESSAFTARTFVHRTDRGELRLTVAAPTVLASEYQGFTDETFIRFIVETWTREFGSGTVPVQVFSDTSGQTGYSASFRTGMMEWSKSMVHRTDEYVLLVRSRWVAMGIAIALSTIGLRGRHVEVTAKRAVFEAKRDAAVRRSLEKLEEAS